MARRCIEFDIWVPVGRRKLDRNLYCFVPTSGQYFVMQKLDINSRGIITNLRNMWYHFKKPSIRKFRKLLEEDCRPMPDMVYLTKLKVNIRFKRWTQKTS